MLDADPFPVLRQGGIRVGKNHVHGSLLQPFHQLPVGKLGHSQPDVGKQAVKLPEQLGHEPHPVRPDAQMEGGCGAAVGVFRLFQGAVVVVQHGNDFRVKGLPGGGQLHRAVGAVEKLAANLPFQGGDVPADGGLRHVADVGSTGKIQMFRYGGKIFQSFQVQGRFLQKIWINP